MLNQTQHNEDSRPIIHIGHSPDPDDAFMWFPLTGINGSPPLINTGNFRFQAVQQDIETLNHRAEKNHDLEITAISIAQYPYIQTNYALTSCGSSMGDGFGPKIVARTPTTDFHTFLKNKNTKIAIPGNRTSALLATQLMLQTKNLNTHPIPFDQIIDRVATGEFDAGVVIHEGQLTFQNQNLHLLVDLGSWWTQNTTLPLPLGGNVIRRDLETKFGKGTLTDITRSLLNSIQYALEHRETAVDYALKFGRGLDRKLADQFVAMYVNKHTLDYGDRGRQAVTKFLTQSSNQNLTPPVKTPIDFIQPTQTQSQIYK